MSLAARRAAALSALARRQPSAGQRFPGETQPSGDMPDDPWRAEAYFAERDCLDDEEPLIWPESTWVAPRTATGARLTAERPENVPRELRAPERRSEPRHGLSARLSPPLAPDPPEPRTTAQRPPHARTDPEKRPRMTLAELRAQLDTFSHLPGDTPVVLATDAEGHGFSPVSVVDDALYEAHNAFNGQWYATEQMRAQNPENDWDEAPANTIPAIFLWPTS